MHYEVVGIHLTPTPIGGFDQSGLIREPALKGLVAAEMINHLHTRTNSIGFEVAKDFVLEVSVEFLKVIRKDGHHSTKLFKSFVGGFGKDFVLLRAPREMGVFVHAVSIGPPNQRLSTIPIISDGVFPLPKGVELGELTEDTFGGRREAVDDLDPAIGKVNLHSFAVGGEILATESGGAPKGAIGVQPFHGLKGGCGALHRVRNTTK